MDKILVTGNGGFLGSRLQGFYKEKYEVRGLSHRELDITDYANVCKVFREEKPDIVLHCAAISDTGYAQAHEEKSYQINVKGSENIARACNKTGAKLVSMSSDQVYVGEKGEKPHMETEEVCPDNVYGAHKLLAEQKVTAVCPEAVLLRLTWMHDLPSRTYKNNSNFLRNILDACLHQNHITFRNWEHRGITYVWEVVENMEKVWGLPGGVYNFGSENEWNTYDLAVRIAERLEIPDYMELFCCNDKKPENVVRNLAINTVKLKNNGIIFRDAEQGIFRALHEYGLLEN